MRTQRGLDWFTSSEVGDSAGKKQKLNFGCGCGFWFGLVCLFVRGARAARARAGRTPDAAPRTAGQNARDFRFPTVKSRRRKATERTAGAPQRARRRRPSPHRPARQAAAMSDEAGASRGAAGARDRSLALACPSGPRSRARRTGGGCEGKCAERARGAGRFAFFFLALPQAGRARSSARAGGGWGARAQRDARIAAVRLGWRSCEDFVRALCQRLARPRLLGGRGARARARARARGRVRSWKKNETSWAWAACVCARASAPARRGWACVTRGLSTHISLSSCARVCIPRACACPQLAGRRRPMQATLSLSHTRFARRQPPTDATHAARPQRSPLTAHGAQKSHRRRKRLRPLRRPRPQRRPRLPRSLPPRRPPPPKSPPPRRPRPRLRSPLPRRPRRPRRLPPLRRRPRPPRRSLLPKQRLSPLPRSRPPRSRPRPHLPLPRPHPRHPLPSPFPSPCPCASTSTPPWCPCCARACVRWSRPGRRTPSSSSPTSCGPTSRE